MSAKRWEVWVCPKHGICRDDGDFVEGQDPQHANANDPDGWTGVLYCGYSHDSEGCYQEVEQIWVVPENPANPNWSTNEPAEDLYRELPNNGNG